MKEYKLKKAIPDNQAEALSGKFLTAEHAQVVIDHDADGYDLAGNLLFRFRKNILDKDKMLQAVDEVKDAIEKTDGRGIASGSSHYRIRKDGSISNMLVGNFVEAGLIGYMDRNAKQPYCRKTHFTRKHFEKYVKAYDFIKDLDSKYAELVPKQYKLQKMMADKTNRNYVIPDTSFTTVTINKNFQTAVHKDTGDFEQGFGNLSCFENGKYNGCLFTLPQWAVGIDIRFGDLLLVDVHQWHANTPFIPLADDYTRISFVMYYRQNMIHCLQPKEELQHIKEIKSVK